MAFDSIVGQHNYIGVHADGPAATAWVQANRLDTTHDGLGNPIDGMMFLSSDNGQMYYWDGSNWVNYSGEIEGGVYVDEIYGSDVSGDGTIGKPYQTLSYACSAQADPDPITGLSTFMTPLVFHVAPGKYVDDVTYPQRIGVVVHGENCVLSGTHAWNIRPSWWTAFGLSTGITPFMVFEGATRTSDISATSIPSGAAERQFLLQNGLLKIASKEPEISTIPDYHALVIDNVFRDGFRIWNSPSASVETDTAVGSLFLFLNNARCLAQEGNVSYIAGEADRVTMDGGMFAPNTIYVWAEDSDVYMTGVCLIKKLIHCNYSANWHLDHEGNPYVYGSIGGDFANKDGERVQVIDSRMIAESFFGYGYKAPAPRHMSSPPAVVFDKTSLSSVAQVTTDFTASFSGFYSAADETAFGRGWFFEDDDLRAFNFVRVPCLDHNDGTQAGKLYMHVLAYSGNWTPKGSPLAADNRLRVEVEAGFFRFETDPMMFSNEFVDVVGQFAIREQVIPTLLGDADPKRSGTIFSFEATINAYWDVTNGSLEGIWMEKDWASAPPDQDVLLFMKEGEESTFKNLWFAKSYGTTGWIPNAVGVAFGSPGMAIRGKWEDCGTNLDGLFHDCSIDGTFIRCVGGENSFAGGPANALDGFNSARGYFEDCVATSCSFGATSGGGDASFLADRAIRCKGYRMCFGCTNNGGNATFNAYAEDCQAYAQSFGAAIGTGNGEAVCAGTLINCRLHGKGGEV